MQLKITDLKKKCNVGLLGCGWIGSVHAEALSLLPNVTLHSCFSPTKKTVDAFADKFGIKNTYTNYIELLENSEVDTVIIGTPNYQHREMAIAALQSRKNVIIEKPLAMTIQECREIKKASEDTGYLVAYAEELCFVPKFVDAKKTATSGVLGNIFHIKQIEKHDGPHSPWFFDPSLAGGGATIDMGVHSIEFARWFFNKIEVKSVWAQMNTFSHKILMEDHSIVHLEFENGSTALLESSWTLKGGMDSRTEIHGTNGVLYVDLLQQGMGMKQFDEKSGWSFPNSDWNYQNGYPQELAHFLWCFENGIQPSESVDDGLKVMQIVSAAYASARSGKKIDLPFNCEESSIPLNLWK